MGIIPAQIRVTCQARGRKLDQMRLRERFSFFFFFYGMDESPNPPRPPRGRSGGCREGRHDEKRRRNKDADEDDDELRGKQRDNQGGKKELKDGGGVKGNFFSFFFFSPFQEPAGGAMHLYPVVFICRLSQGFYLLYPWQSLWRLPVKRHQ